MQRMLAYFLVCNFAVFNSPHVLKQVCRCISAGWYRGSEGDPADPELSPLLQANFADLPPAVVQVAGRDPLRDEGLFYEKLLRKTGVKTKLHTYVSPFQFAQCAYCEDRYPGLPHAFHAMFLDFKATARFRDDYKEGMKWLLGGAK